MRNLEDSFPFCQHFLTANILTKSCIDFQTFCAWRGLERTGETECIKICIGFYKDICCQEMLTKRKKILRISCTPERLIKVFCLTAISVRLSGLRNPWMHPVTGNTEAV